MNNWRDNGRFELRCSRKERTKTNTFVCEREIPRFPFNEKRNDAKCYRSANNTQIENRHTHTLLIFTFQILIFVDLFFLYQSPKWVAHQKRLSHLYTLTHSVLAHLFILIGLNISVQCRCAPCSGITFSVSWRQRKMRCSREFWWFFLSQNQDENYSRLMDWCGMFSICLKM